MRQGLRLPLSVTLLLCIHSSLVVAQGMSTLCRFNAGSRAGQTQDYAPMAAIPVGSPCQDGQGSTGVVVAPGGGGTAAAGGGAAGMSTLCRFNAGSRAGQTQDYAPMAAIPVGSPCQDGQGSTGVVVAPGGGDAAAAGGGGSASLKSASLGTTGANSGNLVQFFCKLTSGPKAGQMPSYLSWVPMAIGNVCHDSLGTPGVVAAGLATHN
jgi:hypothetical protein